MALLFAEQLRDEPAGRVWARGLIDLAITIPARHLEAHMNRPPNPTVPVVFAALSVTGVLLAVVGGSNLGMAGFGLAVAVVAGVLAVASWRTTRAVTAARPASAHWWQVLLGGVGMLATTIVVAQHHRRGHRRMVAPDDAHPPRRHHDHGRRRHPRRRAPHDRPTTQRDQLTVNGCSPTGRDGRQTNSERPCIACPDRRVYPPSSSPSRLRDAATPDRRHKRHRRCDRRRRRVLLGHGRRGSSDGA